MNTCSEPGCNVVIRKGSLRCRSHHAQFVNRRQREKVRADRAAMLVTPIGPWLAANRAYVPADLEWLVDFIEADAEFPAATRLFECRKYLQQFDVPDFVDEGISALWVIYTSVVFPAAPKGQLTCEDCGAPRTRNSKRWCQNCKGKHATIADPSKARAAALKRAEKRREDLALADKMREILTKEGMSVTDVAWSQQFIRENGKYKEELIH